MKKDFVWKQLQDENFSDLFEECLRQPARSLSDERREYLANLLANSLSLEDVEYAESKHLLQLLNDLNDVEISGMSLPLGTVGARWQTQYGNLLCSMPPCSTLYEALCLVAICIGIFPFVDFAGKGVG